MSLSLERIEEARAYLASRIRRTPVEESPLLSQRLGAPVWLKLENLQITGSFKVRAALWRLSLLTPEERALGVATCSAGNHGKGIAFAARALGIAATVYLPKSVDPSKRDAIAELGAAVVVSRFDGYDDTEEWALARSPEPARCSSPPSTTKTPWPQTGARSPWTCWRRSRRPTPSCF